MTQRQIQEILEQFPLPAVFSSAAARDLGALAELYRKAAAGRGSKGSLWGAWLLLQAELGVDVEGSASGLSDGELSAITKWARRYNRPEFRSIYAIHFARQRAAGDYPVQEDTLFYLDDLLAVGDLRGVADFVSIHYPVCGKRECFWERSRLVIALSLLKEATLARDEYLGLERVLGSEDPGVLALYACILAAEGARVEAEKVARIAQEKGVGDDGLNARLDAVLGNQTEVDQLPRVEGGPLRDALDAMAATNEQIPFSERLRRLRAVFEES